jgi:hypothetical protein
MGLLNLNDPMLNLGMGLLSASGPSRMPTSFGQVAMGGMQGMLEAKKRQKEEEHMKQLMAMREMEMAAAKRKQEDVQKMREFSANLGGFVKSPASQALENGQGPTPENALAMQSMTPQVDRKGMYGAMLQSGVPELMSTGLSGYASLDDKQEAAANRRAEFEARIAANKEAQAQQIQARKDALDAQLAGRQDMARLAASLRPAQENPNKPPSGYRFKPNGDMEPVPGGPADQKAQAQAAMKAGGATDVDVAITQLRDSYDRLEKGGGITSTKNGPLDNLAASTSASAFGQGVGKMLGTQNQSARNDIAMGRPALLAAMMKATGMSAKQMDSNAELKLWLATATDPTLDVEANRRALANIERKYLAPKDSGPAAGDVVDGYRFKGGNPADRNNWERQ